jgi:hypothetical protein
MTYELKTYSPSYLEKQYEIGNHRLTQWLGARQTPVERLKKIYSQPDFDPETKYYALADGEVIGFMTAKIRNPDSSSLEANLEFPIVANGHENAEDKLIEFALDSLKSKGIAKVRARVSEPWGNSVSLAEKHGYEKKELMWKNAELVVDNYQPKSDNDEAYEVTEADHEEIHEIMMSFRKNRAEEAQAQIDKLVSISERVTSWKIVREGGKIVGHDHLVEDIMDSKRARMNAIYATDDSIRDRIMNNHIKAVRAKGIEQIDNFFFGPTENMDGPYRDYGFEVAELWAYEKEI